MKRKLLSFLSIVSLSLLLGACSSTQETVQKSEANTASETTPTNQEEATQGSPLEQSKKEEVKTIGLDEVMVFDDHAEVTITNVEFTKIVKPPSPDGFYSYYEAKGADETYLHIKGTYKNLETNDIDIIWDDSVNIDMKYQDKYNYDGFYVIEEADGSDFDALGYISPLSTATFHNIISVPTEVEKGDGSLTLTFSHGTQKFMMKVR